MHRRSCLLVLVVVTVMLTSIAPVSAAALAATSVPSCQIASPETITAIQFVNGQFVNGTWTYATGAACPSNLADIALYEQLAYNGTKVDSKYKGFTGVPRNLDAIQSSFHCATCNGTWTFEWAQILEAGTGFTFTTPPSGCVVIVNGRFEVCVQTKTVVL